MNLRDDVFLILLGSWFAAWNALSTRCPSTTSGCVSKVIESDDLLVQ